MNYLALIWADGRPAPEEIATMQRELPVWDQTEAVREVRLFGRELELPQLAATVRVRDDEVLVSDGPFAETKEFIAGFDVLECPDEEGAIEYAAECPISRFQPIEIRPFAGEVQFGERARRFGRSEDEGREPYLLSPWIGVGSAGAQRDDRAWGREVQAWREDLQAQGLHILGHALGGPETATTVQVTDGERLLSRGPFTALAEFMAAIDVVSCVDRAQAIELAASHPSAARHAIEVRPFYVE